MLVFRMLCRITQSSDVHRTETVSVMDHKQTMGVNSRVLDQKQQNKHLCPYLVVLERRTARSPRAAERSDHDWLIHTPVSTVQQGMLVQSDADTCSCTPGHTLCIEFSAEWAANVVDLKRQ